MSSPAPLIATHSISKRFGGVLALDRVSVSVNSGELLAICGENGAGKSTLMKILCGQHTDYEGELWLRGKRVQFADTKDAERQGVSIIHQELNLVEQLSVAANVFLGRELTRGPWLNHKEMNRKAAEYLEQLECRIDPRTLAGQLRVGDQQLVEIAKALSVGADILIMDEPTSALTEAESARLDRVISRLRQRGVTILYISHKMEEIFRLADRITVLRDGQYVTTVNKSESNPREIAHLMVGRPLVESEPRQAMSPRLTSNPILRVRQLRRQWPNHPRGWKVKDINFDVSAGEIVGFAGLMGAGRTELFETLFGLASDPVSGSIEINGRKQRFAHPQEAIAAGLAMVSEDRKRLGLFHNLAVGANISLNALKDNRVLFPLLSRARERGQCRQAVEQLRIKTAGLDVPVGSLSGGNQQKCVIARSLLTRPRLLMLDDPTRGIDVGAKAEIYRLIRGLAEQGLAVLMSSSELPELLLVCDRILVLSEGELVAEFSAAEATEERIMEAATRTGGKRPI